MGADSEGGGPAARDGRRVRLVAWIFSGGFVLALLLGLASFLAESCRYFSAASEFSSIQVGATVVEVRRVTMRDGFPCAATFDPHARWCTFSDFWRNYVIELDPKSGTVVQKSFEFRRHRTIFAKLYAALRRAI